MLTELNIIRTWSETVPDYYLENIFVIVAECLFRNSFIYATEIILILIASEFHLNYLKLFLMFHLASTVKISNFIMYQRFLKLEFGKENIRVHPV